MLARQAAAAVGMGTCWQWETAATLSSARRRKALRRQRGKERGGRISWRPPAYSLFKDETETSRVNDQMDVDGDAIKR